MSEILAGKTVVLRHWYIGNTACLAKAGETYNFRFFLIEEVIVEVMGLPGESGDLVELLTIGKLGAGTELHLPPFPYAGCLDDERA